MKILRATGIFCKKYVCKYVNNYKIFWNFIKVSFFLIITFLKKFYRSSIKRLSLLISPQKKRIVFSANFYLSKPFAIYSQWDRAIACIVVNRASYRIHPSLSLEHWEATKTIRDPNQSRGRRHRQINGTEKSLQLPPYPI